MDLNRNINIFPNRIYNNNENKNELSKEERDGIQNIVDNVIGSIRGEINKENVSFNNVSNIDNSNLNNKEDLEFIELNKIKPFKENPFKIYSEEQLESLADSIKDDGLINPILLWKRENRYIIISGHNRFSALKKLGHSKLDKNMYQIIENIDYDDARLILADANLIQRQKLFPSERAKAYKIQQEVFSKKNTNRTEVFDFFLEKKDENTSKQADFEKNSHDGNFEKSTSIYRYLRLNFLISELLEKVDENIISLVLGVEISYLDEEEQRLIYDYFIIDNKAKLDLNTIKKIREKSEKIPLSTEVLDMIIENINKPKNLRSFKMNFKDIRSLTKRELKTDKEAKDYIIQCVRFYEENNNID